MIGPKLDENIIAKNILEKSKFDLKENFSILYEKVCT